MMIWALRWILGRLWGEGGFRISGVETAGSASIEILSMDNN